MDVDLEALQILSEYPLIVPYPNFRKWEGFMQTKDLEVHLEIDTPNYPSLRNLSIKCPPEVWPLLISLSDKAEDSSLINLLRSFSHALKSRSLFVTETLDIDKQKLSTFSGVLKELETLENCNIAYFDVDELSVTLSFEDSKLENHEITIEFDSDYPKSAARIRSVDLPEEVVDSFKDSSSVKQTYENFIDSVESLIQFWEMTKQLESECWVIDPEIPSRKDTHRRIFITTDLSVSIKFSPLRLDEMPEITFFGCISAVEQKRSDFMSKLETLGWDFNESPASNLKTLLAIEMFPMKPHESSQDPLECLICACGGNEQGAPAQKWCENGKCPSVYHRSCLYKWFNSLQTSKQYWDYICGPCPFCKTTIWCPMKEDIPAKKS